MGTGWAAELAENQTMQGLVAAEEQERQNAKQQRRQSADGQIADTKPTDLRSLALICHRRRFGDPGVLAAGRTGETLGVGLFEFSGLAAMDATMFHALLILRWDTLAAARIHFEFCASGQWIPAVLISEPDRGFLRAIELRKRIVVH